ncbi:MAG TPA: class I SAM-dependent methyltransferase [Ectothiorhodospiraceae bacterium]|nr:class I SAM-dependent methyltransferase [Ectothiorhodospiraceae bacterium]
MNTKKSLYATLEDRLNLKKGLPITPDWSAAPDFMTLIVEHALATQPATIFECSSGLTTLMLARCCQMNGQGHLYSLENGPEYAANTRSYFKRYGLDDYATVIYAPLENMAHNDDEFLWYSPDEIPAHIPAQSIDMVVIDGPPGFIQKNSRYPALPQLFDLLADGCTIFLDDAVREDEKRIVALWLAEYPRLEHQYIDAERGCSILTVSR